MCNISGVASGGTRPGAQAWRAHQLSFCSYLKTRFEQKFRQSMLKNAYFLERICKIRLSVGGFVSEPPLASGGWKLCTQTPALLLLPIITTLSSSFQALTEKLQ